MKLGIRELRDGLSRHLESVDRGETIIVTDHGRPVARIVPIGADLEALIADGTVTLATESRPRALPPPVVATGTVSDLVAEQRR